MEDKEQTININDVMAEVEQAIEEATKQALANETEDEKFARENLLF